MSHDVSCVLISNSDDFRFLTPCLEQINGIFKEIVIAIGSSFWNGEPEDTQKISDFKERVSARFPNVRVFTYAIPGDEIKCMRAHVTPAMYWEGHARWVAMQHLRPCEYLMFLDSDEVVDGRLFSEWLETGAYRQYDAMKLRNYWYWRKPIYRANEYFEDSVVLIKNGKFNPLHLFSNMGRHGVFETCTGKKIRDLAFNDQAMIHHYSWVRDKNEMMRKVRAWGHRDDKTNWVDMVEEEFSRDFNGTDFVKNLHYDTVPNVFNIE
jgi:hypothetical protein